MKGLFSILALSVPLLLSLELLLMIPPPALAQTVSVSVQASPSGASGGLVSVSYTLNGIDQNAELQVPFTLSVDQGSTFSITRVERVDKGLERYLFIRASPGLSVIVDEDTTITLFYDRQIALLVEGGEDISFDPLPLELVGAKAWYDDAVSSVEASTLRSWDATLNSRQNLWAYELDGERFVLSEREGGGRFSVSVRMEGRGHILRFLGMIQYRLTVIQPFYTFSPPNIRLLNSPTDDEWYDADSRALITIDRSWDIRSDTRRNLVGWFLDGASRSVEREGGGSFTLSVLMDEPHTVAFEGVRQFRLLVLSVGEGSVSILNSPTGDEWFDEGGRAVLVANTPFTMDDEARFVFSRWVALEGSPEELPSSKSVVRIRMEEPLVVEAQWERDVVVLDRGPRLRVDVGSTVVLRLHFSWRSDGSDVKGFTIAINGTDYTTDGGGWVAFTATSNRVGRLVWLITEANGGENYENRFVPEVIFDRIKVLRGGAEDTRVDVGSEALIWFQAVYEYDGEPFEGGDGRLFVSGEEARWNPSSRRWEAFIREEEVGRRSLAVSGVREERYGLRSYISVVRPIAVIWDRIVVLAIEPSDLRLDLGEKVQVRYTLVHEYDGEPVEGGEVLVDGEAALPFGSGLWFLELKEEEVGRRSLAVTSLRSEPYGITAFEHAREPPSVIWDRITILEYGAEDARIDVGEEGTFWFVLASEYDGEVMKEGRVLVNGSLEARWNGELGRWEVGWSYPSVGRISFVVTEVLWSKYGIEGLDPKAKEKAPSIIWDRLEVYEAGAEDTRVDVGSEALIWFKVRYAFDGREFTSREGSLTLNASEPAEWSDARGRWEVRVMREEVGSLALRVEAIQDGLYGLSSELRRELVKPPRVIWDRVVVRLKALDERIDVGSEAPLAIEAWYEYDGRPFEGEVRLNDTLRKEAVGLYSYSVKEVLDEEYGIRAFTSNSVSLIFDQVRIELLGGGRWGVGKEATIAWKGEYLFDGRPFEGEVRLNDTLIKLDLGTYGYSVEAIEDPLYQLKAFTSNSVALIFDELVVEHSIEGYQVGQVRALVKVSYSTDDEPVEDAIVRVNGLEAERIGPGIYEAKIGSLEPSIPFRIEVKRDNFDAIIIEGTAFPVANIIANLASQVVVALMILGAYRFLKRRGFRIRSRLRIRKQGQGKV